MERPARQFGAIRQRQVAQRPAEHEVEGARAERSNRRGRGQNPQRDLLARADFAIDPGQQAGQAHAGSARRRVGWFARANSERAASDALADQREVGLSEQFEQMGARGGEADFDHPVGHGDDILNGAQRVASHAVSRGAHLPLEDPRHVACHDLAPVGPFARR